MAECLFAILAFGGGGWARGFRRGATRLEHSRTGLPWQAGSASKGKRAEEPWQLELANVNIRTLATLVECCQFPVGRFFLTQ